MVRLLSIFSAIATILALLGVYGVMAYNVSQRSAEVGLRIAVGAQPRDLVGLMVRKGACLAGAGVLIGLIGAIGVSRFLTGFLNGVSPSDVRTFTGMASAVFFVAVFATYIPARNAALADPSEALRRH